jgi:non-heme chloroperoxidase
MISDEAVAGSTASRRALVTTVGTIAGASALGLAAPVAATNGRAPPAQISQRRERSMHRITTRDGTELYFKDWGTGQPVVFSHGWPLTSDAFEDQMFFLARNGYRAIAADRRGHGRSSQPWDGNDLDTYADDLAELVGALDLRDAIHVGHSTGGGEVTRYIGRHGTSRVAKAVLISAIPPLMLKTADNPLGLPVEEFDKLRSAVLPTGPSSGGTSRCRSSATIGPARRSRRACASNSCSNVCSPGSRPRISGSRHGRRRTSRRI